ncbi:MAG: PrsW family intramembrane metalloprotease [bacterium]|nr:PrsW family intramembrane metalloprotease [bacterium]
MDFNNGSFALSDMVAIAIIAGLLSLLPVVIMLWFYYVRQKQPSVSGTSMFRFFSIGVIAVIISVLLEKGVFLLWQFISPITAEKFFSDNVSMGNTIELFFAAGVTFGIVAIIEEGTKYLLMRRLIWRTYDLDQIIDGVQLGIATGLGFAFLENTFYFLTLFKGFEFDTLVIVFFLRFLISTVGHMSFGGIMGYQLAKARFNVTEKKSFNGKAIVYPWLMHGFFNFLLAIQLAFYNVILLIIPLAIFWYWWHDDRLFHVYVLNGHPLKYPIASKKKVVSVAGKTIVEILPSMSSCPNCYVIINEEQSKCDACGIQFHRKKIIREIPFLPNQGL